MKDLIIGCSISEQKEDIEQIINREIDYKYLLDLKEQIRQNIEDIIQPIAEKHNIDIILENDKKDYKKVRVRFNIDLRKIIC